MTTERRRDSDRWKFLKEISIGDIVGILAAASAILTAYYKLDTRITVLEAVKSEIGSRLDRIENKLDRAIERK